MACSRPWNYPATYSFLRAGPKTCVGTAAACGTRSSAVEIAVAAQTAEGNRLNLKLNGTFDAVGRQGIELSGNGQLVGFGPQWGFTEYEAKRTVGQWCAD